MILVPVRKFSELLTLPVIDPSEFCFHFVRTGISSFGRAFFAGAFFDELLPPKNEKPEDAFLGGSGVGSGFGGAFGLRPNRGLEAGFDLTGAAGLAATGFFAAGFGVPKSEKPDLGFTGSGSGSGSGSGFGLPPKNEKAGAGAFFTGAGAGVGVGALGTGLLPKNENDGAGAFFTGAGAGAGAGGPGAGLLPKSENDGAGAFFTGAGAGFGAGAFFGAGLLNLNIWGEGVGAGAFFGARATDFFGAGAGFDSKSDDKLRVGLLASFCGSGVEEGFVGGGGFGFGFGVGVEAADFGDAAGFFSNKPSKLNVGRGFDATGFSGGFSEDSLFSPLVRSKMPPRLSVGLGCEGGGIGGGFTGSEGLFFGTSAISCFPSLTLACISSHFLATARAFSAAASWIERALAIFSA